MGLPVAATAAGSAKVVAGKAVGKAVEIAVAGKAAGEAKGVAAERVAAGEAPVKLAKAAVKVTEKMVAKVD